MKRFLLVAVMLFITATVYSQNYVELKEELHGNTFTFWYFNNLSTIQEIADDNGLTINYFNPTWLKPFAEIDYEIQDRMFVLNVEFAMTLYIDPRSQIFDMINLMIIHRYNGFEYQIAQMLLRVE